MLETQKRNYVVILMCILGTPGLTFIDSPYFAKHLFDGRLLADALVIMGYIWVLLNSDKKLFKLALIMPFIGLFYECFGSLIFEAYHYRLNNIPLYIPIGHAVVYAAVYELTKLPLIWQHHKEVSDFSNKLIFVICFVSLLMHNDVGGFLGYLFFLVIISSRKKPLFYQLMFLYTFYLELCGTSLYTWKYYGLLGNHPSWPHVGILPCGISGIYMVLDITANSVYFHMARYKHTKWKLKQSKKAQPLYCNN